MDKDKEEFKENLPFVEENSFKAKNTMSQKSGQMDLDHYTRVPSESTPSRHRNTPILDRVSKEQLESVLLKDSLSESPKIAISPSNCSNSRRQSLRREIAAKVTPNKSARNASSRNSPSETKSPSEQVKGTRSSSRINSSRSSPALKSHKSTPTRGTIKTKPSSRLNSTKNSQRIQSKTAPSSDQTRQTRSSSRISSSKSSPAVKKDSRPIKKKSSRKSLSKKRPLRSQGVSSDDDKDEGEGEILQENRISRGARARMPFSLEKELAKLSSSSKIYTAKKVVGLGLTEDGTENESSLIGEELVVDDWEAARDIENETERVEPATPDQSSKIHVLDSSPSGRQQFSLGRKGRKSNLKSYITSASRDNSPNAEAEEEQMELYEDEVKLDDIEGANVPTPIRIKALANTEGERAIHRKLNFLLQKGIENSCEIEDEKEEEYDEMELITAEEAVCMKEHYFRSHSAKAAKTSNATLHFTDISRTHFLEAINQRRDDHKVLVEDLCARHETYFPQFLFELEKGFNIMAYGYGSKIGLLTKFVDEFLKDGPTITINGFFPLVSLRTIISKVLTQAFQVETPTGSSSSLLYLLLQYLDSPSNPYPYITFLIHNIDSPSLSAVSSQEILAKIAAHPRVYMVISTDHINCGILWDTTLSAMFNCIWHDMTNYQPYIIETSFENGVVSTGKDMSKNRVLGIERANKVLESLSTDAKAAFYLLATHQINMVNDQGDTEDMPCSIKHGLSSNSLFSLARQKFNSSTKAAFNVTINEFIDHELFVEKSSPEDGKVVYIPMSAESLSELLKNK